MGEMAKGLRVDRLSALSVGRAKTPGLYPDGRGLYLQVAPSGARSWILRYRHGGRRRDMGLGAIDVVGLADARMKAAEARKLLDAGHDPIDARNAERAAQARAAAQGMTFEDAARACIDDRKAGWRNAKHAAQWLATLEAYAFPTMGDVAVSAIDSEIVLKVLRPIWSKKTETASRVRGRIETVLDWAKANDKRGGENPARWRGMLDQVLPKRFKVQAVRHHAALPYPEVGPFMRDLKGQAGVAASALQVLILTATRTSEVVFAKWSEFDLHAKTWIIPGERTKSGKPHRVPLTGTAINVLKTLEHPEQGSWVFPGDKHRKPLSTNALLALLRRMERTDITAHGFRSTFRDWAAEQTNFPDEVRKVASGHKVGDAVLQSYQRTDLLEKRRRLMSKWADFIDMPSTQKSAKVTPLRRNQ